MLIFFFFFLIFFLASFFRCAILHDIQRNESLCFLIHFGITKTCTVLYRNNNKKKRKFMSNRPCTPPLDLVELAWTFLSFDWQVFSPFLSVSIHGPTSQKQQNVNQRQRNLPILDCQENCNGNSTIGNIYQYNIYYSCLPMKSN